MKYLKRSNLFLPRQDEDLVVHNNIPAGNYLVRLNSDTGEFFYEEMEPFILPKKLYGDTTKRANRILKTFHDREQSTGVLLVGEKGSGKTLLAKAVSVLSNFPVFVITSPFHGDAFKKAIQDIDEDAVVFFDEFEKVYDDEEQKQLLTLFDGVFSSKKLFLVTTNTKYKVQDCFKNRPGRMYYMFEYDGLDSAFIKEYAEDNLKPELKKYIDSIDNISKIFEKFNFDMLKALIEEMNRFDEAPTESVIFLNTKPDSYDLESQTKYSVKMFFEDESKNSLYSIKEQDVKFCHHPLSGKAGRDNYIDTTIYKLKKPTTKTKKVLDANDEYYADVYLYFSQEHLIDVDMKTQTYTYRFTEIKELTIIGVVKKEEDKNDFSFNTLMNRFAL